MKRTFLVLGVAAFSAVLAFAAKAAKEDVLIQADKDFAKAAAARGVEGFLSFFAENSTILPKNSSPVTTKAGVSAVHHRVWAQPGFTLEWTPLKAVMARSGDLGYTYGTYVRKYLEDGKQQTETGKYLTIWRKQRDGSWKVELDTGN